MKKILFYTNILSPYRHTFFNQLSNYFDVKVIYRSHYFKDVPKSWSYGNDFSYEAIFLSPGIVNDRKINIKSVKYLFDDYDYLFFTNYGYLSELINILFAIFLKRDFFIELDGLNKKPSNIFKNYFRSFIFKRTFAFFLPSKDAKDIISEYAVDSNFYKYNFSSLTLGDIEKIERVPPKGISIKSRRPKILCVGQFINRKGPDVFIKVAELLPQYDFVWIGKAGSDNDYNPNTTYPNNLSVLSFMNKSDIFKHMSTSDIFFFPTHYDVWGLVIIEALAHGLPVVSTYTCGSANEVIEHGVNGFLVDSSDVDACVLSINNICRDNSLFNNMRSHNIELSYSYTIDEMVTAHLKVL